MSFALRVDGATKEWNGKRLFENASLEVSLNERVALIGRNGVGKTSFIEAIMGRTEFTQGTITHGIPLESWGWIEQELRIGRDISLFDFVLSGRKDLATLRYDMERLQGELETGSDDPTVVDTYMKVLAAYTGAGGYDHEVAVEMSLKRLGFDTSLFPLPYQNLSGGQKTRAQFSRLLATQPLFLLLDEPTNHLDAKTLDWLESWLKSYQGSVLFVSHDRYFLDAVASTTYELTPTGTRRYTGGYTAFREAKDIEVRTQQALYDKQQRERTALLEAIQRYKEWYERAHNGASERDVYAKKKAEKSATRFKAKERTLERLETQQVDRPKDRVVADIAFHDGTFEAKTFVRVENADFSYPHRQMFQGVLLDVRRGDRIAVLGPNGVGKSTLLSIVTGKLEAQSGSVKHHPQTTVGYFAQELNDLIGSKTVLETMLDLPGMTEAYARTVLASFLFPKEEVFKTISSLSMGERCRVAFVRLYFSGANLLILDEPTNYLDIDTRERVEEALLSYPGALMVVSHDRVLLGKLANRVIYFEDKTVQTFDGTIAEFNAQRKQDNVGIPVRNEIERLELSLTQLMSVETDGPMESHRLMAKIRDIKSRLQELRG